MFRRASWFLGTLWPLFLATSFLLGGACETVWGLHTSMLWRRLWAGSLLWSATNWLWPESSHVGGVTVCISEWGFLLLGLCVCFQVHYPNYTCFWNHCQKSSCELRYKTLCLVFSTLFSTNLHNFLEFLYPNSSPSFFTPFFWNYLFPWLGDSTNFLLPHPQ